jgi:hypothetical protein
MVTRRPHTWSGWVVDVDMDGMRVEFPEPSIESS